MKDLHDFLADHLISHKERIKSLGQLTQGVARTLLLSRDADHWYWPYSCSVTDDNLEPKYKKESRKKVSRKTRPETSISTQAMICASIDHILLRAHDHKILDEDQRSKLMKTQQLVEAEVLTLLQSWLLEKPFLKSSTFGIDDIFTASWLLQMHQNQREWPDKEKYWTDDIKRKLVTIIADSVVNKKTKVIDYDRGLFTFDAGKGQNEAGPHSLPLLKVIRALKIIKEEPSLEGHWPKDYVDENKSLENAITLAGDWLEKNLHRQMSFYRFKDFRFDAAELIFCLYGSITTGQITRHESIIDNVLDAVRTAQKRSVYWRPYRPMTSSSQGGVLLPLSIEVAMALLETLKDTGKFMNYADTLEEYSKWLYSQRLIPSGAKGGHAPSWVGWHSENAYESKVIHIWDTALVGAFLSDLMEAKDANFQVQVLSAGGFTIEKSEDIDSKIDPLEDMIAPDLGLDKDTAEMLSDEFIAKKEGHPKQFSLLVYGPPGSSKTTLAKAISKSLDWPLVYLSPSNFITSGEAGIEQQAKGVFDALGILRNKVIFFDEIDRLILDRDSPAYAKQADMFQFMTPSMLTKINDLRRLERAIFIIATNYEERIDKAIKRKGRIDVSIPWLPMDLQARTKQFQRFIDRAFKGEITEAWAANQIEDVRRFAMKCSLLIYPELNECFEKAKKKTNGSPPNTLKEFRSHYVAGFLSLTDGDIPKPEVSLKIYESRTTKGGDPSKQDDFGQGAYFEYACLLIIRGETDPEGQAKQDFKDLQDRWRNDPEDYEKKWPEVERRATAYGLGAWI